MAYISKINANNTTYTIGGSRINGKWDYSSELILANSINVTAEKFITYDLSSYLPNDTYTYEVLFTGAIWCAGSSGSACGVTLADGTYTTDDEQRFLRCGRCNTRSASTHGVYFNGIVPITYANGRKVTFYNKDSSGTAASFQLKAAGYRRIGANSDSVSTYISKINANGTDYTIGGKNFNSQPAYKYLVLINGSALNANSSTTYDLSSYLPSDSYTYEVLITVSAVTTSTSGQSARLALSTTDMATSGIFLTCAITRSSSTELYRNAALIAIPPDRQLTVHNWNTKTGAVYMYLTWYRRVGEND